MTAPQPSRIFLSYARRDGEAFAADLFARIDGAGIAVWRDREGMRGGDGWWDQIDRVLDEVEFMVVAMTPGAIESPVVRREWDSARRKGVCIFPVIASDDLPWSEMPAWMRKGHCYDLSHQAQKFINDLNTRCQKVRVPFMVEALPDNHVPRPVVYEDVFRLLVQEERREPKPATIALRGAGGFGKTTLARALCHDIRTRLVFYDGILWVTVGHTPLNLAAKVEGLIYELAKERPGFTDPADASNRLRELLQDKNVLVVIDDVWREADARPFLVGGAGCAWLLTTRNREALPANATEIGVDQMSPAEAVGLLAAGLPAEGLPALNPELAALAERLGEWPLLLSLVNRILVDRVRRRREPLPQAVVYARTRLDRQGLVAFDRRDAGKREEAASMTINASLDQLQAPGQNGDAGDEVAAADPLARFRELAVFPEDAVIPVDTAARLWAQTAGVDDFVSRELCNRFFDLSLLQSYDLDTQTVRLHDVIWNFLQQRLDGSDLTRLHQLLLESYDTVSGGRRAAVADDGYYYDHLVHHLIASGNLQEAHALLGPDWRRAQFGRVGSDRAFAADVETALTAARRETPLDVFAIGRAAYICASLGTQAARVAPEALGALSRLGRSEIANGYASLIHDAARQTRAFCLIANGLVQRGDLSAARAVLARALESAGKVEEDSHRARSLSEVAETCAVAGDMWTAARAAEEGVRAARESTFDYHKAADLLAAARALLRAGLPEHAMTAAAEALTVESSQSTVKRASLLVAAATLYRNAGDAVHGDAADAQFSRVFEDLNKEAASGDFFDFDDVPALVQAVVEAGNLGLAGSIANAWGASWNWTDVKSLAAVARAQLAADDRARADETASRLVAIVDDWSHQGSGTAEGPKRNHPPAWDAFVDVVCLLAELGRDKDAMRVSERIADADRQSAAYGVIAGVYASRTPGTDTREPLARAFAPSNQRPVRAFEELHAAASVITALIAQGAVDQARAVVDTATRIAGSIDTSDWEARKALTELAVAQSKLDPARAVALSDLIASEDEDARLEMLTEVAIETPADGGVEAHAAIARTLALLEDGVRDHATDPDRIGGLALAASRQGDVAMAERALARMKALEPRSPDRSKVTSGRRLAVRALVALGDVERAIEMAGTISDERVWDLRNQVEAYDLLVAELLARGDRPRAADIAARAVEAARSAAAKEEGDTFKNDVAAGVVAARTLLAVGEDTKAAELAGWILDDLRSSGIG